MILCAAPMGIAQEMMLSSGFEKLMRQAEPLAPYTWFRVGGPAEYLAEPNNAEELAALIRRCREQGVEFRLLGSGSNILVPDVGVPGVVIRLSAPAFSEIIVARNVIAVGAGARLGHLISTAAREGLAGLESLVGIPGTVGGALVGNAGSHGGDIGQWVTQATVMSRGGELSQLNREQMEFAYRESSLDDALILSAQFQLEADDPAEHAHGQLSGNPLDRVNLPVLGERLIKNLDTQLPNLRLEQGYHRL